MTHRGTTLLQRHTTLQDVDRSSFKHDAIQIWVYRNFHSIIKQVFPALCLSDSEVMQLSLEHPITDHGYRNFVIGFVDVYSKKLSIAVEVKTGIPVVGDLIRQIQFYRNYLDATWIVVSPDDRNADILKDQQIHFFKYYGGGSSSDQLNLFVNR
jgi:hypothetical protein